MSRATWHGALLLGAAVLAAPLLHAEPTANERATAEAMFQQATQLMDQQHYAAACEKFAASQQLDPGLGTQLYLADCYDRAGRSASAWALFREVEDRARRANQPDRERIAHERAEALEGKLPRLELRVTAARQIPGLELSTAGSAVPRASWNVALPVDAGLVRIEARAPGRKPWTTQVKIAPGPSQQTVEIPALALAPRAEPPASQRFQPPEHSGSVQRTAGMVVGGAGLIGLAVGGFFGYRAYTRNQDSKGECRADLPNACTATGARLRSEAADAAKLSTIFTLSGAGLFTTGVTLVLTAPSPGQERALGAARAQSAWGVEVGGVW
jgi:serine/threonine-protein kinase